MTSRNDIQNWFSRLQEQITGAMQSLDGKGRFIHDDWVREGGGGGQSRVITDGSVFEKGGVNFSAVWGPAPEAILRVLEITGDTNVEFFASGVSIVIHPRSPMVPIIHMNVRYFELSNGTWWFGGGIDLTPHYVVPEDATYFHQQLKNVCDRFDADHYRKFKAWADDYFYLKHRHETRGIGGIFFDHLNEQDGFDKDARFAFVKAVGESFVPVYSYLVNKNRTLPYTSQQQEWQLLRRGRYVEFNLLWDRGTKFGLDTDGRTESILMSLPPQANWQYNHVPTSGSAEALTQTFLKKGIQWAE